MKPNTKTQVIMDYASQLSLTGIPGSLEEIITSANQQKSSYADFALSLLKLEIDHRSNRDLERRQKAAWLPLNHNLEHYDHSFTNGLSRQQVNQLRECMWLEQNYNLVLMGPSGVGKTYFAAGLCSNALKKGYKAYFRTMEQIMEMLKLKDITKSAGLEYKKLLKAHLLVIDDIMLFALDKQQAVGNERNVERRISNVEGGNANVITLRQAQGSASASSGRRPSRRHDITPIQNGKCQILAFPEESLLGERKECRMSNAEYRTW